LFHTVGKVAHRAVVIIIYRVNYEIFGYVYVDGIFGGSACSMRIFAYITIGVTKQGYWPKSIYTS